MSRIGDTLPPEVAKGANVRGAEYGWDVTTFPASIAAAQRVGYACLRGHFQFRLGDGNVCEMYWLTGDSDDRVREAELQA
jgi:hypothetical protein